jgi:murein L,D-transpeptidase YafK
MSWMVKSRLILSCSLLLILSACQSDPDGFDGDELPLADYILVEKSKRTLSLFNNDKIIKTYNVAIGRSPDGHKEKEGDHKTPEGVYSIIKKNPKSRYHRALKISYPNKEDEANARKKGHNPGGDIMIHGMEPHFWWVSPKHKLRDITRGCIVVTNQEIEEIFEATPLHTKVEIKP